MFVQACFFLFFILPLLSLNISVHLITRKFLSQNLFGTVNGIN